MRIFLSAIFLIKMIMGTLVNIKGNEKLSPETKLFLSLYPISINNDFRSQKFFYESIEVNKSIDFNISFPENNGDIAVGPIELYGLLENGNEKLLDKYHSIEYNISPSVYIENNHQSNLTDSIINCTYTSHTPSMKSMVNHALKMQYSRIKQYSKYSIGLFGNSLYDIKNNSILKGNDKLGAYIQLNNIDNYWIIKQQSTIDAYLATLDSSGGKYTIVIYTISLINDHLSIKFFNEVTSQGSLDLNVIKVNDIGIYGSTYILGTDKGMYFIEIDKGSIVIQFSAIEFSTVIVLNDTAYAIGLKQGLFIFDLINRSNIKQQLHPNMVALDYVSNAFTGLSYIGIYLDSSSLNNDDFFIELLIKDPLSPITSKVYSLKGNAIKAYSTPDSFFTYFYNEKDNKVYRIRRAILSSVSNIIDSVTSTEHKLLSMTAFYDDNQKLMYPAIITNNQLIAFDYDKADDQLQCRMNSFGNFTLVYEHLTDSCACNLGKGAMACLKIHYKVINVFGDNKLPTEILVVSILIPVVLCTSLALIIMFWKRINCCGTSKLRLIDINKNDRVQLYQLTQNDQSNMKMSTFQPMTSMNKLNSMKNESEEDFNNNNNGKIIIDYNKKDYQNRMSFQNDQISTPKNDHCLL